jgi:hypothetical protein
LVDELLVAAVKGVAGMQAREVGGAGSERPVGPMDSIFRAKPPGGEHTQATNILTDYASNGPERLAELLMIANSKTYVRS